MNWLWLNVPLMAVFFLAMAGVPLWLVFRHPDTGPAAVPVGGPAAAAGSRLAERREPASWRARAR